MATIASLLVNLGMNVAGFSSGAKQGIKDLDGLAKGAMALNAAIGIANAGAAGMSQLINTFKSGGEAIDRMNDFADRTGFTTEKLGGLAHAAKMNGVEIETLNGALGKMTVNLGKAKEGGPAADALEKLGLNAQLLINLGPDAAFNSIANSISRLPSPAEKAAAAVGLFGRSGLELVNVLDLGASGLAKMQQEAESLGLATTKSDAEQVAAAFDAMDKSGEALHGMFRELAIVGGPTVRLLAEGFTEFLQQFHDADGIGGKAGFLLNPLSGLGALADAQDKIAKQDEDAKYAPKRQKMLAEAMDEVTASAEKQVKAFDGMKGLHDSLADEQRNRTRLIEQSLTPLEEYAKKVDEIRAAITKLGNTRNMGLIDHATFMQQRVGLDKALNRVNDDEAKRRNEEVVGRVTSLKDSLKTPGQNLRDALRDIQAGQRLGILTGDQSALAQLNARKSFLEAMPSPTQLGDRPGALIKGTSEAFSASFGSKPVDKTQSEIKQIQEKILTTMQNIDRKSGTNFQI